MFFSYFIQNHPKLRKLFPRHLSGNRFPHLGGRLPGFPDTDKRYTVGRASLCVFSLLPLEWTFCSQNSLLMFSVSMTSQISTGPFTVTYTDFECSMHAMTYTEDEQGRLKSVLPTNLSCPNMQNTLVQLVLDICLAHGKLLGKVNFLIWCFKWN